MAPCFVRKENGEITTQSSLSLERIEEANSAVDPVFRRSPQFVSDALTAVLDVQLLCKIETLNPIRSFKGRGADYLLHTLAPTKETLVAADLLVSFPNEIVTDFSIMVAPQELATDSTATLRVTAFMNGSLVGTNTSLGSEPFLWPSSTLSFSSAQGFNSVVIHYASPPPTGGDYGVIFVADNMAVTATLVPEPSSLSLLATGVLGLLGLGWNRRFSRK